MHLYTFFPYSLLLLITMQVDYYVVISSTKINECTGVQNPHRYR